MFFNTQFSKIAGLVFFKTLCIKKQKSLFQRNLYVNNVEFERELDEGMYGDADMLQLLNCLCQNRKDYLIFELNIIIIINRLINMYLLEKKI